MLAAFFGHIPKVINHPEVLTVRRILLAIPLALVASLSPIGQGLTAADPANPAESPSDFNGDGIADVAIGSPGEAVMFLDELVAGAGAVHVLYGSATGLQAISPNDQRLTQEGPVLEDPEADDNFGTAVGAGDFDGDGFDDLAVGVPNEDSVDSFGVLHADAGKVSVIYGSADGLKPDGNQIIGQVGVVKGEPKEDERFGSALAAGDFNDDGFADLGIGVPGETVGETIAQGAVNVLYGSVDGLQIADPPDQRWAQGSPDVAEDPEDGDAFGSALAAGDFDNDGTHDLAIGVPSEDLGADDGAGAVNVLYGSSTGLQQSNPADQLWTQDSESVQGAAEDGDLFGSALGAGDFDNDGRADLTIGAPGETLSSLSRAGLVNVLYGSASGLQATSPNDDKWTQDSDSVQGTAEADDLFGSALGAGDFDNDGHDDLSVGAPGETLSSLSQAGLVNVLYGSASGLQATGPNDDKWTQNSSNVEDTAEAGDLFGNALISGDFDGTGADDLAIGVRGEEVGGFEAAGATAVLYGGASGLQTTAPEDQFWHLDSFSVLGDPGAGDGFGTSLAAVR
jgi:hypothetical protein